MTRLTKQIVDYLMDDETELDNEMEQISRSSVSSKEVRIKAMRNRGEIVGNDNGVRHHRKY